MHIEQLLDSLGLSRENFDARKKEIKLDIQNHKVEKPPKIELVPPEEPEPARLEDSIIDQISTEDNPRRELESEKVIRRGPFEVEGREFTWNDI